MAMPTFMLRVLSLYGRQSLHFLATTEKSENPQKSSGDLGSFTRLTSI
jgi:hypothetical protein